MIKNYLSDATCQKEVAYLIVVLARKEAGILNSDCELLREYYDISVRNSTNFSQSLSSLASECKDLSDNLKFDLVIRKYRSDGSEIIPKTLQQSNILDLPI